MTDMAGMRRVMLPDGRVAWVNALGEVVGISEGMGGAEPGFGSDERTRDIYSRLPDADVVGLTGPGVVPGGEKTVGIQRGGGATPPNVRPMQGSQANNRGNSVILAPGNVAPLIVSTPPNPGEDAEMISATLGFQFANGDQNTNVTIAPLIIRALLTWGVGNAIFSAECDWSNGMVVCLPASFLRIGARFEAQGDPGGLDVKLDAALGYGNLGRSRSARFTDRIQVAVGATSGPNKIPPFAVSYNILSTDASSGTPAGPIIVDQRSVVGGTDFEGAFTYVAGTTLANMSEDIPIANGSRYIYVVNNGLVAANVRIIYNLAF